MDRIIVHFIDEDTHFINIEGTDIFERDDYLFIYNDANLVGVILKSIVKVAYKSKKGD